MNGKGRPLARVLRWLGCFFGIVVLLVAALLVFLSVTEYKPEDVTQLAVEGAAEKELSAGDTIRVLSWNVGYGALGDNADFFMDGGSMVQTADDKRVRRNLSDMAARIDEIGADVVFLQEVDRDSTRSCRIDELAFFREAQPAMDSAFASNFLVRYLPYPVPPIGKVDSGIAVFSAFPLEDAQRIQLPIPFAWPIRMANLKRCALITRVPLAGQDRSLTLIDLHLEAYDDGEGKVAQTQALAELLRQEAAQGNYVIAGGDFNQIFSNMGPDQWPVAEGLWAPGQIDVDSLGEGWQCLMDPGTPSCRSLDKPYAGADRDGFQYYLIDGFIVSSDLTVKRIETLDAGFTASDHNPVVLEVTLS